MIPARWQKIDGENLNSQKMEMLISNMEETPSSVARMHYR